MGFTVLKNAWIFPWRTVIPSQDECYAPSGVMLRPDDTWHWGICSIPYITGLLHGSNLKVHPSRNQWKEWGTRFSGIGANLWCKSRSIYESNICIYIDIFTCLVSYTDGFYLHLIYIYIIFTCVQFIYIYIYIYIWFQISLEPSAGQMTCLSSQLSGCSFRQRF